MPLFGTGYLFSKKFFTGWVSVGIVWIFCSFIAIGLYPAWESRATLARVVRHMMTGKAPPGPRPELVSSEDSSVAATPVKGKA